MNKEKQLSINMIAAFIALFINLGINFFLSRYIVNNLGADAYGFVTLANNFVNYASLVTIALNSVAGRFITIEIHRKQYYEANRYFTSVLMSNCMIGSLILLAGIIFTLNMESLINIPARILLDVKVLFMLVFVNFIVSIVGTTYAVATFVKNRLDLSSIQNIVANLIKVVFILFLFCLFKPSVLFIGISSLACSIFIFISNIYYTKKLAPEIIIRQKYFSIKKTIELISSGIWNTISKLAEILIDGLDLLMCNLFISSLAMGQLAVAKTIAMVFQTMLLTAASISQPQQAAFYAKNEMVPLIKEIKLSMKLTGFCANIPLAGVVAFGLMFYQLWIPAQNIKLIYMLTLLTLQGIFVSGIIFPLFNIYTLTNKLKISSFAEIISGVLNITIVLILVRKTNFGIYAVAGVSTILAIIRNLTFTPLYSAYCLNTDKKTFYPTIIRYILVTFLMVIVFSLVRLMFVKITWGYLFIAITICVILGCILNYFFLLDKNERIRINSLIKNKLNKNEKVLKQIKMCGKN